MILDLLRVLPGPVDVVAPGNDDGKLVTEQYSNDKDLKSHSGFKIKGTVHLKSH